MSSLNITCRLSAASLRLRSEMSRAISDMAMMERWHREAERSTATPLRRPILSEPLRLMSLDSLAAKPLCQMDCASPCSGAGQEEPLPYQDLGGGIIEKPFPPGSNWRSGLPE